MKKPATTQKQQEALDLLKDFINSRLPEIQGKIEIHAKHETPNRFEILTITKDHALVNITYLVALATRQRLNKNKDRILRSGLGEDLALKTLLDLEHYLGLGAQTFRYVQH